MLNDIVDRSRRSQHESHTRIMLRQIARNEYVPARTLVDVVAALKDSLGAATTIQVYEFEVPQVHLDWNLMWHEQRDLKCAQARLPRAGVNRRESLGVNRGAKTTG